MYNSPVKTDKTSRLTKAVKEDNSEHMMEMDYTTLF